MSTSDTERQFVTTTEASRLVKVTQGTVRMAILEGRLPASKAGGIWYIERNDLLAWNRTARRRPAPVSRAWDRTAGILAEYGAASTDEITALAGIHVGNVRKHLAILAKEGRVERLADGQWVLTAAEHQGAA